VRSSAALIRVCRFCLRRSCRSVRPLLQAISFRRLSEIASLQSSAASWAAARGALVGPAGPRSARPDVLDRPIDCSGYRAHARGAHRRTSRPGHRGQDLVEDTVDPRRAVVAPAPPLAAGEEQLVPAADVEALDVFGNGEGWQFIRDIRDALKAKPADPFVDMFQNLRDGAAAFAAGPDKRPVSPQADAARTPLLFPRPLGPGA